MRYRDLFVESEFRALYVADVLSIAGTYLARVAVASLVYQRTGSAALTAAAFAISYLPYVFSPWLASFADLFPRRLLLVICDLARAVCIALILVPGLSLGLVAALLFLEAVWRIPWGSARLALLSDILDANQFPAGNALVASTRQALQVGGFAVGGVVVALIGVRETLAVDVVTYLVSAMIIAVAVRRRPAAWTTATADAARAAGPTATTPAVRPSTRQSTVEGVQAVLRSRRLCRLFALLGLGPAVTVITEGLAVPFSDQLGGGVTLAGLIMAAPPLGTVVGLILLGRLPLERQQRLVAPMALGCGLTVAIAGLAASLPGARALVLAVLVVSGVCVAYISAIQSEISAMIPTALRGRLFGLANAVLQLSQGAAIVIGGVVASMARVDSALVVLALVGTAAITLLLRAGPTAYDVAGTGAEA